MSFSSLLEAVKRNTWACLVFLRSNSSIIQIRHQILGLVVNHRSYHIIFKMIICWPPKVCNQDIDERWRKQNSTVVIPLNWFIQRHVHWRWCLRSVASTPCNFRLLLHGDNELPAASGDGGQIFSKKKNWFFFFSLLISFHRHFLPKWLQFSFLFFVICFHFCWSNTDTASFRPISGGSGDPFPV